MYKVVNISIRCGGCGSAACGESIAFVVIYLRTFR